MRTRVDAPNPPKPAIRDLCRHLRRHLPALIALYWLAAAALTTGGWHALQAAEQGAADQETLKAADPAAPVTPSPAAAPSTAPKAADQAAPKAPGLTLEAIDVRPPAPGPDTLCQLRVRVRNGGTRKASALAFEVRLNGQALPVYANQVYLQTLAPGAVEEVRLFNFWTTESGRPAPADGKLKIEVALREARWVEVKTEGGAEVWRPQGAVEGLPASAALTLTLKPGAKR